MDKDSLRQIRNDPKFYIEKYLWIKTKAQTLINLKFNHPQEKIYEVAMKQKAQGKAIRLIILKARQEGVSTLAEALIFHATNTRSNVNSFILAHDADSSENVFNMTKLFHDQLPTEVKQPTKNSSRKELHLKAPLRSKISVDTAGNIDAGRSFTIHNLHCSEVAFWANAKEVMLSLMQSVPDLPNTMIILESTANGMGGYFHDEWVRAIDSKSDFLPVFIPWFELPEYSMPLKLSTLYPIDMIMLGSQKAIEEFEVEEDSLRATYNLTDEQLNWRRWCIANKCGGDILNFRQEYPIAWREAFITSGELYFDREAMRRQETYKPFCVGNLVKKQDNVTFEEEQSGKLKIYSLPTPNGEYIIGGDAAEGLPGGDRSAAVVIDKETNSTVAVYNQNIDTDEFAFDLSMMCKFYNEALVAVESKGYGSAVNQALVKEGAMVYRRNKTRKGYPEQTEEVGFNTNSVTRPEILALLRAEIRESITALADDELIKQCWSFMKNPSRGGKPEAQPGCHDDLVMARAIAGKIREYYPYYPPIDNSPKSRSEEFWQRVDRDRVNFHNNNSGEYGSKVITSEGAKAVWRPTRK